MIKAICFDLDGVYFTEFGFKRFKQAIVDLGVNYEDIEYYLHKEPMNNFKKGKITEKKYWEGAVKYWNIRQSPEEIMELLPQGYEVNKKVDELVKEVRENGYKTCICSNNFVTRVNKLDEKFHFLQHFDATVFSYEIGFMKPRKEIFEELLKRLNVKAEELIYSDDNEDKLNGALELGINAFVYKNFEQFKNTIEKLGVNTD